MFTNESFFALRCGLLQFHRKFDMCSERIMQHQSLSVDFFQVIKFFSLSSKDFYKALAHGSFFSRVDVHSSYKLNSSVQPLRV